MDVQGLFDVPFTTGLRRMFYVVTPNETSFATTEEVTEIVDQAHPYFLLFIILEFVLSRLKGDEIYRMNDTVTSVSAGLFSRFPGILIQSITMVTYCWVYSNWRIVELPWDSAWTWWLCFLGEDLAYYWFHRFAHEVNFMWAAHQVHHSSEDYNFSTALRQSLLQTYTSWIFNLPMAFCIPPSVFLVHCQLNLIYQFWIHTQYVPYLGPLEYIICTPSAHRVHHGRNPYCIDKNYGGTLIIWDRIFGTYMPEGEEVAYGLTHPIETFDPFDIQFGFVRYMVNLFKTYNNWTHKMASIFCGPGWLPGKPRTGDPADIPKVEFPPRKYHNNIPTWLNVYVLFHFVVVLYAYLVLLSNKQALNPMLLMAFLGYLLLSLTSFGQLFNRKKFGIWLEATRCSLFLMGDLALCSTGFYSSQSGPTIVKCFRAVFIMSLIMWMGKHSETFGWNVKNEKTKHKLR